MSEIICEQLAHQSGFTVSVGNWIDPAGLLIVGINYSSHHWETLVEHLQEEPDTDHLTYMNKKVEQGYIRLVFREDVYIHVVGNKVDDLWSEQPNFQRLMEILKKIDTEIHIFSCHYYLIGNSYNIVQHDIGKLQIRQK